MQLGLFCLVSLLLRETNVGWNSSLPIFLIIGLTAELPANDSCKSGWMEAEYYGPTKTLSKLSSTMPYYLHLTFLELFPKDLSMLLERCNLCNIGLQGVLNLFHQWERTTGKYVLFHLSIRTSYSTESSDRIIRWNHNLMCQWWRGTGCRVLFPPLSQIVVDSDPACLESSRTLLRENFYVL